MKLDFEIENETHATKCVSCGKKITHSYGIDICSNCISIKKKAR